MTGKETIIDNSGCEFLERNNGYCEKCEGTVDCYKVQCSLKEYYILAAERKITPLPGLLYSEAIEELVKIQKQIIKELNCTQTFPGQCRCAFRCLGNDFCEDAENRIKEIEQETVYVPKLGKYVDRYCQNGNGKLFEDTDIYKSDVMGRKNE